MEALEAADLDNHIVAAADQTSDRGAEVLEDVHILPMAADQMVDSKTFVYEDSTLDGCFPRPTRTKSEQKEEEKESGIPAEVF